MASMEACIPALRRYARSLLHDRQDADDLVHDCLVRALDQIHTRREDGDLRAWLFAIMHNLFVSRTRRNKTAGRTVSLQEVGEDTLSIRASQDVHMQGRDLLRALDALSEEHRSVLLLVSVEDLSYAEVSQVLGVPIGTVMSRLSRARERLRLMLEGETTPALRRVK
ncbi:MAG TPA: sigma-70 family RNA polymerase sigma factor [Acetobacteraceae bacterium]|nr:sigma-70 family RNA polymerase sigma factor [Acetobacteraceae bacterium]